MRIADSLPASVIRRKAIVYVRQSTPGQVHEHQESQRRQYNLTEVARRHGFTKVEVIDDDLGRSASGASARPGFERLVAELCAGDVGGVLSVDASRLSRNGRDWHHLLELCGLVDARVIDVDGVYDPRHPNDRLLLGMKGTMSEFELGVLRVRLTDARQAKAQRGELRIGVPVGYVWDRASGLGLDPDVRLQEVIRLVFAKFRELGSARQVLLWMHAQNIHYPRPSDGKTTVSFEWTLPRYRNVISLLKNPFYAGVYVYGKSENRTQVSDGRAVKTYGHAKPMDQWEVFIKDHHDGYITWEEFERNQAQLAKNAYSKAGGCKSGRGGRALLAGLLTCGRCGRRLKVVYTGRGAGSPKYRCDQPNLMLGQARCMAFGTWVADRAVVEAALKALEPAAMEASIMAEQLETQNRAERKRLAELDLKQARYEASLGERRFAGCDPDNRLVADQLERAWEDALRRVEQLEKAMGGNDSVEPIREFSLGDLAGELQSAWHSPTASMRTRQRLIRALVEDIVVDLDEVAYEIELVIHWKGGRHSRLRVPKPRSGEHRRRAGDEVFAVVRSMAGRWNDEHIAASLNRMGLRTGQGKTWTAVRVCAFRGTHEIPAYRSGRGDDNWLTMSEAARELGVTNHVIRRLIHDGDLPAVQVVSNAPYQIRATDLKTERIRDALERRGCPRRPLHAGQTDLFSNT